MASLKEKVEEFATIAGALPENLQVTCFELLLKHHLDTVAGGKRQSEDGAKPNDKSDAEKATETGGKTVEESSQDQDDIAASDLHAKVKRFLERQGLTIDHLNNVFYKEGDEIKPLYDDLKTTKMSESQVRIALLQALHVAIDSGEFTATVEAVRAECRARKCYDGPNFSANFKNNKNLFDFDTPTYTKATKQVRLTDAGRAELAEIVKALQ